MNAGGIRKFIERRNEMESAATFLILGEAGYEAGRLLYRPLVQLHTHLLVILHEVASIATEPTHSLYYLSMTFVKISRHRTLLAKL